MSPLHMNLKGSYRPRCSLCKDARSLPNGELCEECQAAYDKALEAFAPEARDLTGVRMPDAPE